MERLVNNNRIICSDDIIGIALVQRGLLYIVPLGVLLCGTVLVPQARDPSAMPRYIIWCVMVLLSLGSLRVGRVHIFALGYLAFTIFSGVNAVNKSEWLCVVLQTTLMVVYLSVFIDEDLMAKTMILLGVIFAIYFWIEVYNLGDFSGCGLMRQKSFFAAACFFVIPFCMYGVWPRLSRAVLVAMVVNIILIGSRASYLALAVATGVVAVKKFRWYIPVIALVVLGIVAFWQKGLLLDTASFQLRIEFWAITAKMLKENNICGIGAGNWLIEYWHYAQGIDWSWLNDVTTPLNIVPKHPHNDFLWIWAEIGLTGFLFYLGMFGYALWSARKKTYLLVGILGYMAIACFSGLRERPFACLILMTYISLACEKTIPIKRTDLITTMLVFAVVVFGFRLRASCYNRNLQRGTWAQIGEKTRAFSTFSTLYHAGVPWHWWSGMYYLKCQNKEMAIAHFKQAYTYNPYSIHVLGGMGKAAILEGNVPLAKTYFERVLDIYPEDKEAQNFLRMLDNGINQDKNSK